MQLRPNLLIGHTNPIATHSVGYHAMWLSRTKNPRWHSNEMIQVLMTLIIGEISRLTDRELPSIRGFALPSLTLILAVSPSVLEIGNHKRRDSVMIIGWPMNDVHIIKLRQAFIPEVT
jgi:hypothetical protein